MLAINTLLHLLDVLTTAACLFWLLFAVLEISWQHIAPLRTAVFHGHDTLIKRYVPPASIETQTQPPLIVFKAVFPLYNLIYTTLAPQLLDISAEERALLLRGSRVTVLAQSMINGMTPPVLTELGVEPPPQERLQHLASLPDIIVTPPEDGDRLPLPAEEGGRRMKAWAKGFLAPPKRQGRPGLAIKSASKKAGKRRRPSKEEIQRMDAARDQARSDERDRYMKAAAEKFFKEEAERKEADRSKKEKEKALGEAKEKALEEEI